MKGIVLVGGKGSRLGPFTCSGAKQLVPIANTPVLHFPIRRLANAGVVDIDIAIVTVAIGDGSRLGVTIADSIVMEQAAFEPARVSRPR